MALQAISTNQAPAAIGPYSQAIIRGDLLFTSGQLPLDPRTGQLQAGSIEDQAHMVFKSLEAIAHAAGTTLKKTIKTTVFLADIKIQRIGIHGFYQAFYHIFISCRVSPIFF
jgi:2-iminobutanoate/2-iminopropanoate deaminase